jgi:putative oxidoreductase
MKIAATIARLVLGLVFLVFGLNLFLHFLPMGPLPAGPAGQFFGAQAATHYMYVVAVFQVVPAILLLINRYVPLALALLAPVIVNIFLVHLLMAPSGLPLAIVVTILWLVAAFRVRSAFLGLFQQRVED